jgi:hypothetical protein
MTFSQVVKRKPHKPFPLLTHNSNRRIGLVFDEAAFMNKMIVVVYLFFGIIFYTALLPPATAQTVDEIVQAVQSGSSKSLGKFLKETVTLSVNNTLSDYSRNQAEQVLRDFFRKTPAKEFKTLHQDESADRSWYIIGQYISEDANFKVLIQGMKQDGKLIISNMEFSKE